MKVEITGTITATLNLDPAEFAGLDEGQAFAELHKMLRAEHPGVNFIAEEMADAVHQVLGCTRSGLVPTDPINPRG